MPNVTVAWPRIAVKNGLGEYLSQLRHDASCASPRRRSTRMSRSSSTAASRNSTPVRTACSSPSPKVATYDLQPEMSAFEVCDKCVERINSGAYDVIILNFANCDMVGHTGVLEAAVKAVETVDTCVGRVVDATLADGRHRHGHRRPRQRRGICASRTAAPMTAHTDQPRPLYSLRRGQRAAPRSPGRYRPHHP